MEYPSETVDSLGFSPIGLDMPYGIIVQNNPVNFIDPLGLDPTTSDSTIYPPTPNHVKNVKETNRNLDNEIGKCIDENKKCEEAVKSGQKCGIVTWDAPLVSTSCELIYAGCIAEATSHWWWRTFMSYEIYQKGAYQ
jgi:hypothetical protein